MRRMMRRRSAATRSWVRVAARAAQVAWFCGNLYEGVVGIPELLAAAAPRREPSVLGRGSPVRYYAPVAPVAFGATAAVLVRHRNPADRRRVGTVAASLAAAAGMTGYLVRTVNLPLLTEPDRLTERDRRRLLCTWHATNAARLGLLAVAMTAFEQLTDDR